MTLEDFLMKAGAIREEDVRGAVNQVGMGSDVVDGGSENRSMSTVSRDDNTTVSSEDSSCPDESEDSSWNWWVCGGGAWGSDFSGDKFCDS
ncbi:hypothetical protein HRI_003425400 [Hibiscus trionum]|uniref:Uncharacterized protein n=1 Tax=Hibiscus trionum TaxID=183268 RepID=A0A9W7IL60_HIBTR|nr:hypothetical protein HRI_003425400 [Hibiscus trionum]